MVTPDLEPVRSKLYQEVLQDKERVYEYSRAFPRAYILPSDLSIPDKLPQDATAEIVHFEPNRVRIRAELSQAGYLVLADNIYPGWDANLNGNLVPIQPILGTFRGIELPSGAHEVEMVFHPKKMHQGLLVSFASFLLILLILIVNAFLRRRVNQGGPKL